VVFLFSAYSKCYQIVKNLERNVLSEMLSDFTNLIHNTLFRMY